MALQLVARDLSHIMMEKLTAPLVLVVDDEGLIRWALRKALLALGCEVREAGDARSALLASAEADTRFDAVLLDLKLPDSDGLSLLAAVKARQPAARLILMTAFGTEETQAEAIALGACRVIRKPFDVKAVAAMVLDGCQPVAGG